MWTQPRVMGRFVLAADQPRRRQCAISQAPWPLPVMAGREAEIGDFESRGHAEIEFEQADGGAVAAGGDMDLGVGVVEDGGELGVGHDEPALPEPGGADLAEQGAVAVEIDRRAPAFELQRRADGRARGRG